MALAQGRRSFYARSQPYEIRRNGHFYPNHWNQVMNRSKRNAVRDAWRLAKPYWVSEEKWPARGLLLAVVALNLGNVYISVRLNEWNNAFYNALQKLDGGEFFRQLGVFCILAA